MEKIKFRMFFAGLAAVLFAAGYFTSLAAVPPALLEKQLEGIWKPVKFLQFDYSIGKLVNTPLKDVEGGGGGGEPIFILRVIRYALHVPLGPMDHSGNTG